MLFDIARLLEVLKKTIIMSRLGAEDFTKIIQRIDYYLHI